MRSPPQAGSDRPTSPRAGAGSPGCAPYDQIAMPELPEVETIRRQLAPHLEGRTIEAAEIRDWRWTRPADPGLIATELTGAQIRRVGRSGKYLMLGARRRPAPADPPADDRRAAVRSAGGAAAHAGAVRPRRRARPRLRRPAPVRDRAPAARRRRPRHVSRRAPRGGAVHAASSPQLICASRRAAGPPRSSRSSSTSGGSPASATSTPTRRCFAPGSIRCARPGKLTLAQWEQLRCAIEQVAGGRDRREGGVDRRLSPRRRGSGLASRTAS